MRRIAIIWFILGLLAAAGLGVARAQTVRPHLPQIDNGPIPSEPSVLGESQVQFTPEAQQQPSETAKELPATNPRYGLVIAVVTALAVAVVIYLLVK